MYMNKETPKELRKFACWSNDNDKLGSPGCLACTPSDPTDLDDNKSSYKKDVINSTCSGCTFACSGE
jgi:hypothetical protein